MDERFVEELTQLTRYAGALQSIVGTAVDQAPQQTVGHDPEKAVTVTLDQHGLPVRIAVAPDWQRRLDSDGLGPAVGAAFSDAVRDRMQGWASSLRSSGWADDFEDLRAELDAVPPPPSRVAPEPGPRGDSAGPARPLDELVEDALAAMDEARDVADTVSDRPDVDADVARGKVVLRLSADGSLSAQVDADWAGRQSAAVLMTQFDQALGILRLKASRLDEQPAALTARLDGLLGEAMAILARA